MSNEKKSPVLVNPVTQYPGPPFDTPKQSAPGTVHKLKPPADHGETSYTGHGRLAGRRALVTGGDSGIGRAAAIAFAREGAHVVINYLPEEEEDGKEVVALLEKEGVVAKGIPGDLKDEAFCRSLVKQASDAMGGLDILANVAGKQTHQQSIEDITTEQFDATFKTNVYGLFWLCKAALEVMPAGSTIVNTASIQSYDPSAILLDYASTKAAIVAFTKALAGQVAERGIRVNAVAPGPVWTALQPSGGQPMEKLKHFGAQVPLKRPGQPVECAPVYVLLASNESSFITGETYGVTGGNPLP
ncbi:SDR family oxidoreductase [Luteibacter aegosomaticola]|uniref:SDR family oxidoreductase n=1 Tax=Luteibacter aegosomaticola TaxID=2911538 RepID=UPI001FFADB58|nr:SDR family oxidoreductase [Luteibacter aegosomaticola]UPG88240.1 SDR family oxidoreductase [Luteibacter aegosomaticola]